MRPALTGSYEAAFHETGLHEFALKLEGVEGPAELRRRLLQRAIGVIYRPETERWSHYYEAHLSRQFDALLHEDTTRALEPLAGAVEPVDLEEPETFPTGM